MLLEKELINSAIEDILNQNGPNQKNISLANRILFEIGADENAIGDIVFVCGNPTCVEDRIVVGVEMLERNKNSVAVLSGGVKINSGHTESEAMKEYCIRNGIDPSRIHMENNSTTTKENVLYSIPIISSLKLNSYRIIAISSAHHLRRVIMNFNHYIEFFPQGTTIVPCASIHPSCDPSTWHLSPESRKIVAIELGYIRDYVYQDGYDNFII